jgi:hypothetical protein
MTGSCTSGSGTATYFYVVNKILIGQYNVGVRDDVKKKLGLRAYD